MIDGNASITDLLKENPCLKPVIERYDDTSKNGNKTIDEVCIDYEIPHDFMLTLLNSVNANHSFDKKTFEKFRSEIIINYLSKTHHYYLYKSIPEIEQGVDYLLRQGCTPLACSITRLFIKFRDDMISHIHEEEKVFFPYVKYITHENKYPFTRFNYHRVVQIFEGYSSEDFLNNHDEVESILTDIRRIITNNKIPKELTLPYNILLNRLELLEMDLKRHAVLEEEIIVPRVVEAENELWEKIVQYRINILSKINTLYL